MLYSVWNSPARSFDYYEGPGDLPDGVAKPRSLWGGGQLGVTPEEAAPLLPMGSRKVGSGEFPRGVISVTAFSGLGAFSLPVPWLVGGALAALWLFGGRR